MADKEVGRGGIGVGFDEPRVVDERVEMLLEGLCTYTWLSGDISAHEDGVLTSSLIVVAAYENGDLCCRSTSEGAVKARASGLWKWDGGGGALYSLLRSQSH